MSSLTAAFDCLYFFTSLVASGLLIAALSSLPAKARRWIVFTFGTFVAGNFVVMLRILGWGIRQLELSEPGGIVFIVLIYMLQVLPLYGIPHCVLYSFAPSDFEVDQVMQEDGHYAY